MNGIILGNIRNLAFILVILLLSIKSIFGQYPEKVEQVTIFTSKIDNPIKIEVKRKGDNLQFSAKNRSFYSYKLKIEFQELYNLTPKIRYREFEVSPGTNYLFSLSLEDRETIPIYYYKWSHSIGIPSKNVKIEYPYLIPVSTHNSVELYSLMDDPTTYIRDYFRMKSGDTVFNMRKGYIAAVPDMYHDADRVSRQESLEIIHEDGTIMIYENIKPDSIFVKLGSTVYPAQPLGIINENLVLILYLYKIRKDGKLEKQDIHYYIRENSIEPFSKNIEKYPVEHPHKIITNEMSKREIKKLYK